MLKTQRGNKKATVGIWRLVMIMKLRNGNVAIEEAAADEKSEGGLYIPKTVSQKGNLRFGKVIDVGPGEYVQGFYVPMDIEKGNQVIFDISRTEPIEVDGKKLIICNMVNVIAVMATRLSVVPPAPVKETAPDIA